MSDKKAVIALGYFDGAHKGHNAVIFSAIKEAERLFAIPVVFTFDGNLRGRLSGGKCIFTASERAEILKEKGFAEILSAPVSDEFLSLSPAEFLDFINEKYDIKGYACGEDYRFGKNGEGDVAFLKKYAAAKGQTVAVCSAVYEGGEKVSATRIKNLLFNGEIDAANKLLSFDYFISGIVKSDRGVGRMLGFPTVNVNVDNDKSELKNGVYAGYAFVEGVKYAAVINYGNRPTYNLNEKLVEAHLIGFSGTLYGKTVRIYFTRFLRDIKKFDGEQELKSQLKKDVLNAKQGDNK